MIAGKTYRVKFSVLGADNQLSVTSYLRQSFDPYHDLSSRKGGSITANRQEKEFLFTATDNESNASLGFDIPEQNSSVYLDNIRCEEVEVAYTNPDEFISFIYNPTAVAKTFSISPGADVYGNHYQNAITISPFQSVIILKNAAEGCLVPLLKPVILINP